VAEYRIPLSQLRFGSVPAGTERVWGFQIMRDIARRSERTSFNPWTPDGSGFVSRFGDLTGLVGIPEPQRLEVSPYVSAKVTRQPGNPANPFYRKTDTKPNVGGDVRHEAQRRRRRPLRPAGRTHPHRHHQPRLRPGRGRPRRRQPLRLRDLLPREAAVLPRGLRRLQLRQRRPQ
jgi:hypothetical protein